MTRLILYLSFIICFSSCSTRCVGADCFGADEFVLDSYKIKEGKLAILEIEGREVAELDSSLVEECSDRKAISGNVDLIGLVANSSICVDGKTRLFDVLAKAKLSPDANLFRSYVMRDGKVLSVDLNRLIKQGDMEQNIVMCGGDKIYIADASSASLMVMGEVRNEKVISLPNGYMSLRQAIAEAGGIAYTGDQSYIQIIRGK